MKSISIEKRTIIIFGVIALGLIVGIVTTSMLLALVGMLVMLYDFDTNGAKERSSKTTIGFLYVIATLAIIFQYLTIVPYKEVLVTALILSLAGTILYQVVSLKKYKKKIN